MASPRRPNARKPEIVVAALEERMLPITPEEQPGRVAELLDELKRSLKNNGKAENEEAGA